MSILNTLSFTAVNTQHISLLQSRRKYLSCCRIRPIVVDEKRNVINHIGDDGFLIVLDPLKPCKDALKIFEFNRVFGPTSTQDGVYKEPQPLI
ncbi:Kinesin-like protein KIN-14L [Ranunculus cassubicifolius]